MRCLEGENNIKFHVRAVLNLARTQSRRHVEEGEPVLWLISKKVQGDGVSPPTATGCASHHWPSRRIWRGKDDDLWPDGAGADRAKGSTTAITSYGGFCVFYFGWKLD